MDSNRIAGEQATARLFFVYAGSRAWTHQATVVKKIERFRILREPGVAFQWDRPVQYWSRTRNRFQRFDPGNRHEATGIDCPKLRVYDSAPRNLQFRLITICDQKRPYTGLRKGIVRHSVIMLLLFAWFIAPLIILFREANSN